MGGWTPLLSATAKGHGGAVGVLLAAGAVPVINENDTVATEEIRYGDNDRLAARVAQMVPFMKSVFESVGVNGYSLEGNVSSTLDSHRLLEHALAQPDGVAVQDRLIESLFRRYFTEACNLGDREVLAAACTEAEVPGDWKAVLDDDDALLDDVIEKMESAQVERRIHGVPHFTIDGKHEVSGGQEPSVFLAIFKRIEAEQAS